MSAERPSSHDGTRPAPVQSISGWDGKLRVDKADLAGEASLESPPPSDDNGAPISTMEGEQVEADEDLLDDLPIEETDIDLNHCRVISIPALHLERFPNLQHLCLRQNQVSSLSFPEGWGTQLEELDAYDNAISHIKGLDALVGLTSLDLSFNKIKHIKRISHLHNLTDLYFVQNKITRIEQLQGLDQLTNLELAANRIREIENLDCLPRLQELWLGKNRITELKNLAALQSLRLLSVQSNRITSSSLDHLSALPSLTELYISHNALDNITPLSGCVKLAIIDISSNPITSIAGLKPLTELEELWASDCNIDSFVDIEQELRGKSRLTTVYFEGNPIQTMQRPLYRNKVKIALPQVKQVDATYVKDASD